MKKLLTHPSLAVVLLILLFGCHKKPTEILPSLTTDKTTIVSTSEAGKATVNIVSTVNWTITDLPSWLTASATSGSAGTIQVEFNFAANSLAATRTADFTLSGSGVTTIKIHASQTGAAPTLTLDNASLTEKPEGQLDSVIVTANVDWTLTVVQSPSWIAADKATGPAGQTKVKFTVAPNTSGQARTGVVSIAASGGISPVLLTFTQAPTQPLAGFTVTTSGNYTPIKYTFTNTSKNATSYKWELIDNATNIATEFSSLANPTYIISNPGGYTFRLTVRDAANQTSVYQKIITIQPESSLLCYLPFNNGSLDYASVHGNIAWNNGATLTTDRHGIANSAFHFSDRNVAFMQLQNNMLPANVTAGTITDRTISLWFKPDDLTKAAVLLSAQDRSTLAAPPAQHFDPVMYYKEASFGAALWPAVTTPSWDITSQYNANGGWIHVVLVVHQDKQDTYINGNLVATQYQVPDMLDMSTCLLGVGYNNSYYPGLPAFQYTYFNGSIDDVRIYARALSPAELAVLYQE